jgi:RimJ/RimL family protein N-acetyltransferase
VSDPGHVTPARIEPWEQGGLPLLQQLVGDPEMMQHLGGPERPDKIAARHERYLQPGTAGEGRMFRIVDVGEDVAAGSVGYWERSWRGGEVYEIGWMVAPAFQGRGLARAATALAIEAARAERRHRWLHAFPSPANPPSNAICRRLGFTLLEELPFEYPPGRFMQCNDWRLDLERPRSQ